MATYKRSDTFFNDYSYRRKITIDYTKAGSGGGDLTSFPMLVSGTYSELATVANGGHMQNASGYDLRFELSDGTVLDYEIQSWSATTGAIIAWVRIPTLSVSTDTVLYMYYGNSAISTSQANPTGVWDSYYKGVWHMEQDPSGSAPQMTDSTTNANHMTSAGSMTSGDVVAGQIQNNIDFDGSNDYLSKADAGGGDTLRFSSTRNLTMSGWVRAASLPNNENFLWGKYKYANGSGYVMTVQSTGKIGIKFNAYQHDFATTSTISTNQRKYIVGEIVGNFARIIVDGVLFYTSSTWTGQDMNGEGTVPFVVATASDSPGTTGFDFTGQIDEVRMSNGISRGVDWALTEFNNQSSPSTFYSVASEEVPGMYSKANITPNTGAVVIGMLAAFTYTPSSATTYTKDNSVKANIKVTNSKDNSAEANIKATGQMPESVKANIKVTASQNSSVKADIVATTTQANQTKADILVINNTQNNSPKADILVTTSKDNSVKANILNAGQQPNSVKADILTTYSQNNSPKADILTTYIQANQVKANIVATTIQINIALGNILTTYSQINNVKANILVTNTSANQVKADVLVINSKDNNVIGSIQTNGQQVNSVKANIKATTTTNNTSKANILVQNVGARDVVDQSNYSGTIGVGFGDTGNGRDYMVMGFVPTLKNITKFGVWLHSKDGNANVGYRAWIDTADSGSAPQNGIGGIGGSTEITNATLIINRLNQYTLSSPVTLTPGTRYVLAFAPWNTTTHAWVASYNDWRSSVSNPYASGRRVHLNSSYASPTAPDSGNNDLVFEEYGTDQSTSSSVKANIVASVSQDSSVKADILSIYTKDNSVKADIIAIGQVANYALGNILNYSVQDSQAKANIKATVTASNNVKANIKASVSQDNSIKSDIKATYTQDNAVKGSIRGAVTQDNYVKTAINGTQTFNNFVKASLNVAGVVDNYVKAEITYSTFVRNSVKGYIGLVGPIYTYGNIPYRRNGDPYNDFL